MMRIPNSLAIFGAGPGVVGVALRAVLKFKGYSGPIVILDYTGRGAVFLGEDNKIDFLKRPVFWYDTADRQRPAALFNLRRSEHFRKMLLRVLQRLRQIARINVKDETLSWAVEAAYSISKDGTVGLGALMKSLSSSEVRRWFLDARNDPADLGKLLKLISWVLSFPSVYAISEGINKSHIEKNLQQECVVWIESRSEYFEKCEHQIIASLTEAAIEDTVRSLVNADGRCDNKSCLTTIVHLFPLASSSSEIPEWVKETSGSVRHIGVHKLHPDRPLHPLLLSWAAETSNVWVAGKIEPLKKSAHANWLQEHEIERVNTLDYGDLWVKSNQSGKHIVSRIRHTGESLSTAYKLRRDSAKRRKVMPVRQMTSAVVEIADLYGEEYGLYERLCDMETLRFGWFKVKNAPKGSCGSDNITISVFKENLENELSKLADELRNREYRCKPLRRIYISKADGGKRGLGVACVRDRIVQSSCLMLLEPIFEPAFSRYSFAFRPRRNAHQALSLVRSMIMAGHAWAVIADIKKCFDNIDHDVLLNLISRRIGDQDVLNLIRHWLTADVLDFYELLPIEVGVPQGESLSPLLANIYLDPMDKYFEQLGLNFVRYADDIIILTSAEEDAKKALQIMEKFLLEPLRLELKPAKTNYVSIAEGFDFLGFKIRQESIEIRQDRIETVLDMLCGHIKMLGHPASTLQQRADSIMKVNAIIRGWRNYFAFPDERHIEEQLKYLDGRIEQIGNEYLPVNIRDDPSWICRERFLMPRAIEDLESEKETAERESKTGNGYPEDKNDVKPAEWMIKEKSAKNNDGIRKSAIVLEDSGDYDDAEEKVTKNSIVENEDRLYVLTHGSYLAASESDLVIKKRKTEIYRRPMSELGMVFLQGFGMNISVNLQSRLAEMDIHVVFAPPFGEPIAVLNPISSSKSFLRGLQVLRRDDPDIINAGLNMIASKIGNQGAVLKYFSKYRKKIDSDLASQLTESAEEISDLAGKVLMLDPGSASVRTLAMGFEGHAAAIYWQQLIKMMPEGFGFSGRVTKSAKDTVNQCLNYVYGILYGEVWRAIVKAGLDPYFGFMHGSKRDQGSLVFDLIEEFRAPFADRLVIGILGRGFQPEIGKHGFLKTKARRHLAICFSKRWFKKIPWRSRKLEPAAILTRQAISLTKLIKREGDYHPYKMRW